MGLIDKIKGFFTSVETNVAEKTLYGCSVCGRPIDPEYRSECSKECFDEAMMRSYHY